MTKKEMVKPGTTGTGAVYGLGLVGALFYYFQHADGFGNFVMGFLKALVWPAVVVYRLLESFAG